MHTLALAITNRCPLRCDFCCVPPGPGDLDEQLARKIVEDAIESRLFDNVGFTGGEPLLRLNLVEELGTRLSSARVGWGVTTGCGWATSEKRVENAIAALLRSRVSEVRVSVDHAHLKSRSAKQVPYFLQLLTDNNIPTTIACTSNVGSKVPITLPNSPLLKVEHHYISPAGFAKTNNGWAYSLPFSEARCPMSGSLTLSVWPDGDVYPCCSPYVVNKNKALRIGNVNEARIDEILESVLDDPFFRVIRFFGFPALALETSNLPEWKEALNSKNIDSCHLCSKLCQGNFVTKARDCLTMSNLQSHHQQTAGQ